MVKLPPPGRRQRKQVGREGGDEEAGDEEGGDEEAGDEVGGDAEGGDEEAGDEEGGDVGSFSDLLLAFEYSTVKISSPILVQHFVRHLPIVEVKC